MKLSVALVTLSTHGQHGLVRHSLQLVQTAPRATTCVRYVTNKPHSAKGFGSQNDRGSVKNRTTGYTGEKALRRAANNFDRLRQTYGVEACRDVYVKSPLHSPTTYWFVGKIVAEPGIEPSQAALAQKRLIFDYARHELRPQNFAGKYQSALELWIAPGDSEMDVVRNIATLEPVLGNADSVSVALTSVGYNPEIYVGDEKIQGGLRVERDEEGRPIKPVFDVNESV